MPTVHATGRLDDRGYAVVEYVPGEDLHERFTGYSRGRRAELARTFGRYLAHLHEAFSFEGFGPLTLDDGGTLRATADVDWPTWFREYAYAGVDRLVGRLPRPLYDVSEAIETPRLPADPPSTLYPWDLRPGNALVADGEIVAVLDWGAPMAAVPELGLAKVEHLVAYWYVDAEEAWDLRDAFREGYESVRPLSVGPRAYTVAAVAHSALDSNGELTRPGFPERTGDDAGEFHWRCLDRVL